MLSTFSKPHAYNSIRHRADKGSTGAANARNTRNQHVREQHKREQHDCDYPMSYHPPRSKTMAKPLQAQSWQERNARNASNSWTNYHDNTARSQSNKRQRSDDASWRDHSWSANTGHGNTWYPSSSSHSWQTSNQWSSGSWQPQSWNKETNKSKWNQSTWSRK